MAEKTKNENDDKPQEPEAPTYHVDRLIGESEGFFDQPAHVVAGALAGEQKKNFTRDEAKQIITKWLRSEVTTEA